MSDQAPSLLAPRKLVTQLLGFAIGLGLLVWCIHNAIKGGGDDGEGWRKIREADPLLIAGLIGCTLASLAANGAIFWLVIRPVAPLRLWNLQLLNLVTAVLNYAPIRAGLIARIAYHLRVDRLPLLVLGGWLAAIGYTMALTLAAVLVATLLRQRYEWAWSAWALLIVGELIVGGLMTVGAINLAQAIFGPEFLERVGKGMHRMLRQPTALWGAIVLRLVDIGAFIGRMACAAAILELGMSGSYIVLLAVIALGASLFPLGRVGYREWAVMQFAAFLGMSSESLGAPSQLALIESAGEAIVSIPLGALALLWYRRQWIRSGENAAQLGNTE